MRDNVEAEGPEEYFRKSITIVSLLYAKWNENKVYRPTGQNRFGTTVGSINYWKYCSITGFKTITPEKWTNFCNHVENKIEPQYWKSDHIIEEIAKIIINLDSDSDTDSEGDHDSEGETTDMYWSE